MREQRCYVLERGTSTAPHLAAATEARYEIFRQRIGLRTISIVGVHGPSFEVQRSIIASRLSKP